MAKSKPVVDTAQWNRYYREGIKVIGSPSRTHEYVKLRIKGYEHQKAVDAVASRHADKFFDSLGRAMSRLVKGKTKE